MSTSLRTLPILEQWDCHGCGHCCRGTTVVLDEQDLKALADQQWGSHPDFRDVQTVVRAAPLSRRRVLAKQQDGRCIFLTDEGRCRIHELHGFAAKPAVCRMFPLQVVPLGNFAYLTTRRSCPTAAIDSGRPIKEHLAGLKRSDLTDRFAGASAEPPPIVPRAPRSWRDFLIAADVLKRLTTDERLPMVRRLVHGLRFCSLLEECRVRRVPEDSWRELVQCLKASSAEDAGCFFRERRPPLRTTAVVFRLLALHYIRAHPYFQARGSWRERGQMGLALMQFAHGRGMVPPIHPGLPASTFDSLERPLGPLSAEIAQPLNRFFETHSVSLQYAVVGRRRSLVESFRGLAIGYPIALWLLRLVAGDRAPTTQDMVDIVVGLERGQGLSVLTRGTAGMAARREIERLIAWYAR